MIEFNNVKKVYPNGTHALNGIDLFIDKGEFVYIIGRSGAGKSTLIKMMLREEVPTSGSVVVNGFDLVKMKPRRVPYLRRTLGVVFQDFRLIQTMTAFENIAFAMRVTNISSAEISKRVPYVLGLMGLEGKENAYPAELSGGEQQRVALARALVHNPNIIIADEPTGNIDPSLSYEIMELLEAINKVGTTVVVVTHEVSLAKEFGKRTIEIENGKVVSDSGKAANK